MSLRISQSENFNRNIRITLKNIDKLLSTQFDIGERRYEQSDAAVKLRGRDRKTTFGENGKQSANFSRNSSVLHP